MIRERHDKISCQACGDDARYVLERGQTAIHLCGTCLEHQRKMFDKQTSNTGEAIQWQEYSLLQQYATEYTKKIQVVSKDD
jgi:ribosomal protein L37AE/L43A